MTYVVRRICYKGKRLPTEVGTVKTELTERDKGEGRFF